MEAKIGNDTLLLTDSKVLTCCQVPVQHSRKKTWSKCLPRTLISKMANWRTGDLSSSSAWYIPASLKLTLMISRLFIAGRSMYSVVLAVMAVPLCHHCMAPVQLVISRLVLVPQVREPNWLWSEYAGRGRGGAVRVWQREGERGGNISSSFVTRTGGAVGQSYLLSDTIRTYITYLQIAFLWQYFHSLVTEVTHTNVSQDELIYITAKHSAQ